MEAIARRLSNRIIKLIHINNDRVEAYKAAANTIQDSELKLLFHNYSLQSKQFGNELLNLLPNEKSVGKSGKLNRAFMQVAALRQGIDLKGILSSCESGEKEMEKTYDTVLHHPQGIKNEALHVLRKQWIELHRARFKIRLIQYKELFIV